MKATLILLSAWRHFSDHRKGRGVKKRTEVSLRGSNRGQSLGLLRLLEFEAEGWTVENKELYKEETQKSCIEVLAEINMHQHREAPGSLAKYNYWGAIRWKVYLLSRESSEILEFQPDRDHGEHPGYRNATPQVLYIALYWETVLRCSYFRKGKENWHLGSKWWHRQRPLRWHRIWSPTTVCLHSKGHLTKKPSPSLSVCLSLVCVCVSMCLCSSLPPSLEGKRWSYTSSSYISSQTNNVFHSRPRNPPPCTCGRQLPSSHKPVRKNGALETSTKILCR